MKQITEYTTDELIALYKRLSIYATTWWFRYYRMKKMNDGEKDCPIIQYQEENTYLFPSVMWIIAFDGTQKSSNESLPYWHYNDLDYQIHRLKKDEKKNHKDILRLEYEKAALLNIYQSIWWFGGEYEEYKQYYNDCDWMDERWATPADVELSLHSGDDIYIEYGCATNYQMYKFVWETLQYLDIQQLTKLIKFADQGLKKKWENISLGAGRKSRVGEIQQIDIETGEVVNTYTTRNELMEKTGIKKSHLAQCIKTAKDNSSDRTQWKKWVGEDGKKYGFVESLS